MTTWLMENLGTIIASLILAGIVIMIVASMIKRRKNGKHSSCAYCSHCSMCGICQSSHTEQTDR